MSKRIITFVDKTVNIGVQKPQQTRRHKLRRAAKLNGTAAAEPRPRSLAQVLDDIAREERIEERWLAQLRSQRPMRRLGRGPLDKA